MGLMMITSGSIRAVKSFVTSLRRGIQGNLGHNITGQVPLQFIPVFVGIILVLIGLLVVSRNTGQGLIWIGSGFVVGGFGGSLAFRSRALAISGLGGMVLIVIGALFDQLF